LNGVQSTLDGEKPATLTPHFQALTELLDQRFSCRGFLPDEVPTETIEQMFSLAQRTPSWCNTQPWQVHLLSGSVTGELADALGAHVSGAPVESPDLPAPSSYVGPYADRRKEAGYALYASQGIERRDVERRRAALMENFRFFGAPHTAIVTTDRNIGVYGAVDCGGYVSTLLLAAQALRVAAIPQAAIAMYAGFVREHLQLPEERLVVCAVSFGYGDSTHPANGFRTGRVELSDVVQHVALVNAPSDPFRNHSTDTGTEVNNP
jgi:nitroreductase